MKRRTVACFIVLAAIILGLLFAGCIKEDETPSTVQPEQQETSTPQIGEQNTFSLEEVAEHTSAQDCWIVVNGKVYNVTTVPGHGGGAGTLIRESCGTDATELWETKPVTGEPHSLDAQNILNDYYIGDLE
jgi:cytochrome b involved in lipid metabolism